MKSNLRTSNPNSLAFKVRKKYNWDQEAAAKKVGMTREGWSALESKEKISKWATIALTYIEKIGPEELDKIKFK